jgi:hypothetical protein
MAECHYTRMSAIELQKSGITKFVRVKRHYLLFSEMRQNMNVAITKRNIDG